MLRAPGWHGAVTAQALPCAGRHACRSASLRSHAPAPLGWPATGRPMVPLTHSRSGFSCSTPCAVRLRAARLGRSALGLIPSAHVSWLRYHAVWLGSGFSFHMTCPAGVPAPYHAADCAPALSTWAFFLLRYAPGALGLECGGVGLVGGLVMAATSRLYISKPLPKTSPQSLASAAAQSAV